MEKRTDIIASNVFVSWTGADRETKNRLTEYLTQKGISCLESDRFCSGAFEEWCIQAVESCSIFLLLLTPNTFNSEYVKLELEEAKKLDDFKNRIVPVCTSLELYQEGFGGLNEFCSAVIMEDGELTEGVLEQIYEKVNSLLINRFHYIYKEKVKPSFIRLLPMLSEINMSKISDISFDKAFIKRRITEYNDENDMLTSYSEPNILMENGNVSFLCGTGGCGKSQYLNYILSYADNETLPFIVSCEKFNESNEDLFIYLYNQFCNCIGRIHSYHKSNFSRLISSKKLLLMFDGMDEIASESATRNFVGKIEAFYNSFNNRIALIFTSRNKNDAEAITIAGKKSTNYYFDNLSEEEVSALGKKLFFLFDNNDKGEEFYVRVKDVNDEIRSNPLLLTQLAIVYNCSGELPQTSYEILNAVTDITLKTDDEKGLLNSELLKNLRSILKRFAKERYNLISQGKVVEATKIFRHLLKKEYVDYEAKAEFLTEYLKNRAILIDGEFYHKMFLEFFTAVAYYEQVFDDYDEIENIDELDELLSHYTDQYWSSVIKLFLVKADSEIDEQTTIELYDRIANNEKILDYTLLFDTCRDLIRFKDAAQVTILKEILYKSAEKVYPPYGPLFYYVPEYELYPQALKAAAELKGNAKALALVRDVCFMYGQFDSAEDISTEVDGTRLYEASKPDLIGVRNALCELFYTGQTHFDEGNDIYPRCFNVGDAKSLKAYNTGLWGRMHVAFNDELELFCHNEYNEFNSEYIGLISCEYDKNHIESKFKRNFKKCTGFIFYSDLKEKFEYLNIYRKNIRVLYIPESCTFLDSHSLFNYSMILDVKASRDIILYLRSKHENLIIPDNVIEIPNHFFACDDIIKTIIMSNSVKNIGKSAFVNCINLINIEFSNNIVTIGASAFNSCKKLKKIKLYQALKEIHDCAFQDCYDLTVVEMSLGIEKIKRLAFANCTSLINIDLPKSLNYIGNRAFYRCEKLKINLNSDCEYIANSAFEKSGIFYSKVPFDKQVNKNKKKNRNTDQKNIKIQNGVKKIEEEEFRENSNIEEVVLPNTIEQIGAQAFYKCEKLKRIIIPETVKEIGHRAFYRCYNLKEVYIRNANCKIGNKAFFYCYNATIYTSAAINTSSKGFNLFTDFSFVDINDFVEENNNKIFFKKELKTVTIHHIKELRKAKKFIFMKVSAIAECAFKEHRYIESILPNGVEKIGCSAFEGCDNLREILLPETVSNIGSCAFKNCIMLEEIILPENTRFKIIEKECFSYCTSIKNVYIPDNVLYICEKAFFECTMLESVVIGRNVRRIEDNAFANCISLKSITISANFEDDIERIFGDIDRSIIKFI